MLSLPVSPSETGSDVILDLTIVFAILRNPILQFHGPFCFWFCCLVVLRVAVLPFYSTVAITPESILGWFSVNSITM